MPQISCKNLTLGYGTKSIVKNLNFTINSGDYLCIVGENGSGKTTLMKAILGLHKPTFGEVIFSKDIKPTQIGYLPQQNSIQKDFPASVYEIVLSGFQSQCKLRPFYTSSEKEKAHLNMEKLSITNIANKCYRELSGGQQQRVLLARALCATQTTLLLDEPVSGLDPKSTQDMYDIIEELNKVHGITIIMISHDIDAAMKYSSHILHIGKRVFFGNKNDYSPKEMQL